MELEPDKIRFSQDFIKRHFQYNRTFENIYYEIARGTKQPNDMPPIRVVERADGLYMSHDIRRLLLFKTLADEQALGTIPVEVVTHPIPAWQLTTTSDGLSCRIRNR